MGDHPQIVVKSLQRLLERYNYDIHSKLHLPALLRYVSNESRSWLVVKRSRCTARLLIRELDTCSHITDCAEEICKLFEGGEYFRSLLRVAY